MAGMTFNGKPFDAQELKEALLRHVQELAAKHIQKSIGSIRDLNTGEFPTLLSNIDITGATRVRVEGSPEILAIVGERFTDGLEVDKVHGDDVRVSEPRVFLSHAWEDHALAKSIAEALMAAGIDTWFDGWSISAGDSFPEKINEGLSDCTHFVVILTPTSIKKPWVQHEVDAALIQRISKRAKFIPLRYHLPVQELPPLLAPLLSPEVNDLPGGKEQLVSDILGLSRKPALGRHPAVRRENRHEEFSIVANAVAKVFVDRSANALFADPQISLEELVALTRCTRDDVVDALHELRDLINKAHGSYFPKNELFVRFDGTFRGWSSAEDALQIAVDLTHDDGHEGDASAIAERYVWSARRLNPALMYLIERRLVRAQRGIGHMPWAAVAVSMTDETRRFVRNRKW